MSINTFNLIAFGAKPARSQPGDMLQSLQLVFVRPICMIMCAVFAVRAIVTEEMYVAHVQIFDSFHITLIKFDYGINPLMVAITRNFHWSIRSWLWCRGR